ncbi:hypothetical protein QCA50_013164 [Cerrena zonata]|uniref:Glucose-methanol-choline oxidoreductase N-terminal domain-containing protein n=1 Tax=Cerrena zonata TaxID=2478898 RepID=A0AAW0FRW3_9APHY
MFSQLFDFVIIGGGTAGLVVANGLADAIPNATIALLEAGERVVANTTLIPEMFEQFFATAIDWNFTSIPQPHANNRQIPSPRGKLLGGTGIVNGMFYVKSHKAEYDAWEKLGNVGWNFDVINTHIKAVEKYTPASSHDAQMFAANDLASDHGSVGPVDVTYSTYWDPEPLTPAFISSMTTLGVKTTRSASGGLPAGVWSTPYAVKPVNRSHAFYGEDLVVSGITKPNLHLITGAEVTKLELSKDAKSGDASATGVEFVKNGKSQVLRVKTDGQIVLAAGTFQTPKILEFSGIGNATLLKQQSIISQVDLPHVGENLQDHTDVVVSFELKPGLGPSVEDLTRNATFAAEQLVLYLHNRTGALGSIPSSTVAMLPVQSFINPTRLKELIAKLDESLRVYQGTPTEKQITTQRALLDDPTVPDIELVFLPGAAEAGGSNDTSTSHMAIAAVSMHPFSRGNVHINSSNPLNLARLDPQHLGNDFETATLVESIKFIERLSKTAPLTDFITKQITPSPGLSDNQLTDFVRNTAFSSWHPVGPTSMLPRDQGGVVDCNLKVYATRNIYVVDASVIPLSLGTHTMATVYGIAHKAVDILSKRQNV